MISRSSLKRGARAGFSCKFARRGAFSDWAPDLNCARVIIIARVYARASRIVRGADESKNAEKNRVAPASFYAFANHAIIRPARIEWNEKLDASSNRAGPSALNRAGVERARRFIRAWIYRLA